LAALKGKSAMCSKHFVFGVMLEVVMILAPTYLDYLGAAGEFILKLNQPTIEVQARYVNFSVEAAH
jgi:hypothetical protein